MRAPSRKPRRTRAATRTDVGVVRERNEDAAYVDPEGWFACVADGMGGQGAGDVASRTAIKTVRELLERSRNELASLAAAGTAGRDGIRALLDRAARAADDAVIAHSEQDPDTHGMGTTLEIVVVAGADAYIAHVGDSRTYLVRDGAVQQLTHDHTVAEQMRQNGALTAEEARTSPMRSVLVNAIGVTPGVHVDLIQIPLEPGDRLLSCTDGLHEDLTGDELADAASGADLDAAVATLVALARKRGGHDNITGVLVEAQIPVETTAVCDDPWDERTRPRVAEPRVLRAPRAPIEAPAPLADVDDDVLGSFVESTIKEEPTAPHRLVAAAAGRGQS